MDKEVAVMELAVAAGLMNVSDDAEDCYMECVAKLAYCSGIELKTVVGFWNPFEAQFTEAWNKVNPA